MAPCQPSVPCTCMPQCMHVRAHHSCPGLPDHAPPCCPAPRCPRFPSQFAGSIGTPVPRAGSSLPARCWRRLSLQVDHGDDDDHQRSSAHAHPHDRVQLPAQVPHRGAGLQHHLGLEANFTGKLTLWTDIWLLWQVWPACTSQCACAMRQVRYAASWQHSMGADQAASVTVT